MDEFRELSKSYAEDMKKLSERYQCLRDLDFFVMDNSIRESTVGQLRGHTPENKMAIYQEVKKCGFKNCVIASFNHMTRVDDVFSKQLVNQGEDRDCLWAFSEITDEANNRIPNTERVPIGLRKMKEFGLYNAILEIDLGDSVYDSSKVSIDDMCELLKKLITWCHDNLHEKAKVTVNFRDIPDVMAFQADRLFKVVDFLAKLPPRLRLFGLLFEEPSGKSLPQEVGAWARYIRKVMDDNNWDGHLLVHVHEKFQCSEISTLEALINGCTGVWASLIIEGAAMGNASSCVTLMNLIRLGNKKVLKKYNCTKLREAAINVTVLTTGSKPYIKQPVYGERALDMVLNMSTDEFDMASFFGEEAPIRMTTLASPEMIKTRLINEFGEESQFTIETATNMKEVMLRDLRCNRKEEYMSKFGLAVLFDRAGGKLTESMRDMIAAEEVKQPHAKYLIKEIRKQWDLWDLQDEVQDDEMLQFDSFYNGFMAPYFSCYRCSDTLKALQALDMDKDGYVDWSEFKLYLMWAIHEYPDLETTQDVLDVAFRKGLIPAMRDELWEKNGSSSSKGDYFSRLSL